MWRNTALKWYRGFKENRRERYWTEHRKRVGGGRNPDKTFYVIRRRDWYCGLFSLFLTNLQRIDDAIKNGYVPVFDYDDAAYKMRLSVRGMCFRNGGSITLERRGI